MGVRERAAVAGSPGRPTLGSIADFHNRTIAFWIGPWVVTTYAFFAGTAFFSGCTLFLWFCSMAGCDPVAMARLQVLVTLPCALLGLRVFSILTELKELFLHPLQTIIHPGYMLHGGVAGGAVAMAIIAQLTSTSVLVYLDGAALALPLGEAIARVGCHVYGCCWGRPTSGRLGIRYTSEHASVVRNEPRLANVRLHPVQIYSAVFAFLLWIPILLAIPHRRFDGMLAAIYCMAHPLGRFALEHLRQDNRGRLWKGFTHTHFYSAVIFICGLAIWTKRSSLPVSTLNPQIRWSQIATDASVLAWVVPFAFAFFLAYGVHYKAVGTWLYHRKET